MWDLSCKPGTKPQLCKTCSGQGQVRMQQGFFSIQQTCPSCRGVVKVSPLRVLHVVELEKLRKIELWRLVVLQVLIVA